MQPIVLVVGLCVATASAFFGHPKTWNGLEVTFGINPFNHWNFDTLPKTVYDAENDGFWKLDYKCGEGDPFRGMRYARKSDPFVALIFDADGYIAGIQMRIPSEHMTPSKQNKGTVYTADGEYWTLTTYFKDPKTICNMTHISEEEWKARGVIGTGLYIKNGTHAYDVFEVPRDEAEIKKTLWGAGKCFPMMGQHYWFNIRDDMTEDEFFPYCLLYNNGRLDAFCFAANTFFEYSPRFEHPTGSAADKCCIHAPKFFLDAQHKDAKQSTMHVYLTDSPRTGFC